MAEIADIRVVGRASIKDVTRTHALLPLADIPAGAWRALSERAVEPNGYYLPEWALAVNASRVAASAHPRSVPGAMPRPSTTGRRE